MALTQVLRNDNFFVDIAGKGGVWASVGELTSEIDVSTEKLTNSGAKPSNRALPGEQKFNELNISRYATNDLTFSDWFAAVAYDGKLDARNITITVFDSERKAVAEVNVYNAVPTSVKYGEFSSSNPELQKEDVTLAFESWERTK